MAKLLASVAQARQAVHNVRGVITGVFMYPPRMQAARSVTQAEKLVRDAHDVRRHAVSVTEKARTQRPSLWKSPVTGMQDTLSRWDVDRIS